MIFQIISITILTLLTLFLATQGLLSSILLLACAAFSSVLACGVHEEIANMALRWLPADLVRGTAFLSLFMVSMLVTTLLADAAVPFNIGKDNWSSKLGGGIVGFFTAMIVVGSMIIGAEMLPLGQVILGYDRYPNGIPDSFSTDKAEAGVWLGPDKFVQSLWKRTCGGSLGGEQRYVDVHPNLSLELYGYRHTVQLASRHTLPPAALKVVNVMEVRETDVKHAPAFRNVTGLLNAESGRKKFVVVRTDVDGQVDGTVDSDEGNIRYLRFTATQIRAVTDRGAQVYPFAYIEEGHDLEQFVLESDRKVRSLDDAVLVEDGNAKHHVVHDWVFLVNDEESLRLVEVKSLARVGIGELQLPAKSDGYVALAATEYPARTYRKNLASLTVRVAVPVTANISRAAPKATVFITDMQFKHRGLQTSIRKSYERLDKVLDDWINTRNGWGDGNAFKVYLPTKSDIQYGRDALLKVTNTGPDTNWEWKEYLQHMITAQMEPDPRDNAKLVYNFLEKDIKPSIPALKVLETNDNGVTDEIKILPGAYLALCWFKNEDMLVVWTVPITLEASKKLSVTLDGKGNPRIITTRITTP